ncbi:thioesterase family protein [Streptomyces meridianus]|uniref:Thioesterase family protein n=1 Tax=Streptomyces meridianus TaxID=2938945 RepID=A0ABT0XAS5_9ACTN|nr:thioesterase family protein [Streptomyces meridianus]MCM2579622.1 thioesterase family protein [Streptomyces meridianus]
MSASSGETAFYVRTDADRYAPTAFTRGPWDAASQHAGPPAALLGRSVERRPDGRDDMRLARITYEILRPVPIRPLEISVEVVRAGRGTELLEASLTPEGGEAVMRARALRIRRTAESVPEVLEGPAVLPWQDSAELPFFDVPWDVGYHTAMELRFAAGSFTERGPATCWMRPRVPLVAGEETGALERVLVAADSGNGISSELDFRTHVFVNPDLTVHLHRHPIGEWVCVQARTSIDTAGIGTADASLHDEKGPIGRSVQSLFVAAR